jgi:hypothetical protein
MRRLDHVYADKRNENGKIVDENGTEVKND